MAHNNGDEAMARLAEAITPAPQPEGEPVTLTYTNWRGETAQRTITPKRIWWGATDWHPEPQWLLTAFDAEKQADRDFALKDFGAADEIDRLRAENERLTKERQAFEGMAKDNYDRLQKAEAERDDALAQVAAAYEAAASIVVTGEPEISPITRHAITALTPAHAQTALESYGIEKVREGMQRASEVAADRCAACGVMEIAGLVKAHILADMEKLK